MRMKIRSLEEEEEEMQSRSREASKRIRINLALDNHRLLNKRELDRKSIFRLSRDKLLELLQESRI